MSVFEGLLPSLLSGGVVVVIALRAMFRAQRAEKAHKIDWERRMAELDRQRAERLAAAAETNRVAPETIRDGLIELYRAMNEYHMASGAGVLPLEDFRRSVQAEVTMEA
jgi:F0F1-type ATP synthase epsilon subunit